MDTTLSPEIIYEVFDKYGFSVLRIDNFDRGNYAEIRAELNYSEYLSVKQLQDIVLKLNLIEKNEKLELKIVNIDMIHKTMRLNFYIRK
jgi:coproporphyrinogen III oxidase-like Fe-S oxidoreductase